MMQSLELCQYAVHFNQPYDGIELIFEIKNER